MYIPCCGFIEEKKKHGAFDAHTRARQVRLLFEQCNVWVMISLEKIGASMGSLQPSCLTHGLMRKAREVQATTADIWKPILCATGL